MEDILPNPENAMTALGGAGAGAEEQAEDAREVAASHPGGDLRLCRHSSGPDAAVLFAEGLASLMFRSPQFMRRRGSREVR